MCGEEQDDADSYKAETYDSIFIGNEANDAWDDDKESPPAVKKDVESKKPKGVTAEDNAEGDNSDAPNDWFDLSHFSCSFCTVIT